ncbi:glycosyl transferase family 4 [Pseudanabaena sp. SR411]|uniref:MraY family glycosyltransferase n=1 Tax=Pseudanabaena sp. SR411 TaxID=1980935 RepID=UPI000B997ADD|nr:glycosyltransferase family 4 protein [Pseudanabaena sp. SR411]OYQ63072.1 glycosyl transferase family 4 [Pseudanabaena sp. SR411]
MPSNLLLILSLGSFLISWITVYLIKQGFRENLLDIPNDRSSHTQPTPRGGGLGFIIAFAITSGISVFLFSDSLPLYPLWITLIPLAIIGIIDDRQGVPSSIRYLVQLVVAGITTFYVGVFPQPWLLQLGIFGQIIAIAITLIGMTAIINFYNFMDGLDGLVASCTAIQLGFQAIYLNQPILWLLVAALFGFLIWNWSPAKIFMGDVGSTSLGAIVAFSLLSSHQDASETWSALVITFPILGDALYTLFRRLLNHENIFQAHRSHIYQRLQQSGMSHGQVASIYVLLNLSIAISIINVGTIGGWYGFFSVIALIILGEFYLSLRLRSQV